MLCRTFILIMFLLLTIFAIQLKGRSVRVDKQQGKIYIDDKETRFMSGEMHYFRVPAEQWADRLEKIFKAGVKAVSTPIEWATHEPFEETYYFSGQSDIEYFIMLAHKIGLYVIVRCGPYIDADRDFGGFPSWLLFKSKTYDSTVKWLRSTNETYVTYVERWFNILLPKLKPLLYVNGGPILMVQIENNYFPPVNPAHLDYLVKFAKSKLGDDVVLFTGNENKQANLNSTKMLDIPQVPSVSMSIESTNLDTMLTVYQTATGTSGPIMIDLIVRPAISWSDKPQAPNFNKINEFLRDAYDRAISVNYHMFVDGTNFGFSAGDSGEMTLGYITSYDNYAPISVTGEPHEQYYVIKNMIAKYHDENKYDVTKTVVDARTVYPAIELEPFGNLLARQIKALLSLPPIVKMNPASFRELHQGSGFILYETRIRFKAQPRSILRASAISDRGYVFFRHKFIGYLTRYGREHLTLYQPRIGDSLQILVENTGRASKGFNLDRDVKGIYAPVFLNGIQLLHWTMYRYPLDNAELVFKKTVKCKRMDPRPRGPMLYRGQFRTSLKQDVQKDSFLNMENWSKGLVYLNGRHLGRYWSTAGPQKTLYVPGCYLKPYPEENRLIVLELERMPLFNNFRIHFEKTPIFHDSRNTTPSLVGAATSNLVMASMDATTNRVTKLTLNYLVVYCYILYAVIIVF